MSHSADTGRYGSVAIIGRKSLAGLLLLGAALAHGGELQLGRQTIAPGIVLVFEGAARDKIAPAGRHLEVESTDVHLEMLATWATDGTAPPGALPGGFVAYLHTTAKVRNMRTGRSIHADLVPHINTGDGLHYARNIALPGPPEDRYQVEFRVRPPAAFELATHKDWRDRYGERLTEKPGYRYRFSNVDFAKVVRARR